jgi:TolB-like protein
VGFISELRNRRIVQWTASYIVGAWIAVEVLDHFTERGYLHELFYNIGVIWIVVAGLPAALIIGWFHGEKGAQEAPPLEIGFLSGLGILAIVLSSVSFVRYNAPIPELADQLDPRTVAVLYFDGSELDEGEGYLADAFTEDLIAELQAIAALNVISRNGSAHVRDLDVRLDSVARVLDAGTLVEGRLEQRGSRVRMSVGLVDGRSGASIRRTSLERPTGEFLELRAEVVSESARLLREWLGEELTLRQRGSGTLSQEAWSLVQQAERLRKDGVALQTTDPSAGLAQLDRADEILQRAELIDTAWAQPIILRSRVAYEKSRAESSTIHEAAEAARLAIAHGDRAVQKERNNARALEARGTARYWLFLLSVTPDLEEQRVLREDARADLERAIQLDRTLASAFSALAHLYGNMGQMTEATVAAQRAYETDAFLENAPQTLWRLFNVTYYAENITHAQRWCTEGARRFPEHYWFASCQLQLMLTPAVEPNPERAWQLAERVRALAPSNARSYEDLHTAMLAAGVLARAGHADSARAVVRRAREGATPAMDPAGELSAAAAHVYVLLGDHDRAIDMLQELIARGTLIRTPDQGLQWPWRPLQDHPRFRQTFGT